MISYTASHPMTVTSCACDVIIEVVITIITIWIITWPFQINNTKDL